MHTYIFVYKCISDTVSRSKYNIKNEVKNVNVSIVVNVGKSVRMFNYSCICTKTFSVLKHVIHRVNVCYRHVYLINLTT